MFSLLGLLLLGAAMPALAEAQNVVLGRSRTWVRQDIRQLEHQLQGLSYPSWKPAGLTKYDANEHFFAAFKQATRAAVRSGGRIRFDLSGLTISKLLSDGKDTATVPYGIVTAWELQHIRRDPKLFAATDFFLFSGFGFTKMSEGLVEGYGIVPLGKLKPRKRG